MEGPGNLVEDSLPSFPLLQRKFPDLWLAGASRAVEGKGGGQRELSPGSLSTAEAPALGAETSGQVTEKSTDSMTCWLARWELSPEGSPLKGEVPDGDREEAGLLLMTACPPSWAASEGPARTSCLPDFREGRNQVPQEVRRGVALGEGATSAEGIASRHSPWPQLLLHPWSLGLGWPKRRQKGSLSANQ